MMRPKFLLLFLITLLGLCACQVSSGDITLAPTETASLSSLSVPDIATPTSAHLNASPPHTRPALKQASALQATLVPTEADPLRFVFPTQVPQAASAWRPPLYPTPWVPTPYDHFFFARPIAADEINWPLANYRYGGVFWANVVHTGIDIPVKTGTPVNAAAGGRVNWAGYGLLRGIDDPDDPYGLAVVIRHDFGYQGQTLYTVYGHLSRIDVSEGQHVESGDILGLSGATGHVTGPHLHFEVRIGKNNFSKSRNPELWLSPPQGWGVLAGRLLDFTGRFLPSKSVLILSSDSGRKWTVKSYGKGSVNSDDYYRENLVIGDQPAGNYSIWIPRETSKHLDIQILPGRVSYFTYRQGLGFNVELPPTPYVGFMPPSLLEITPSP